MKVLHTSDWHIGKTLYGRKRYHEFHQFILWLCSIINEHQISVLVIAGDIFDTSAPSPQSLTTYFEFLKAVVRTGCRHLIVVGGNHDSPAILNAPREILSLLNIHIVGSMSEDLTKDVFCLRDTSGLPELIVCASPFLRERDVRSAQPGESQEMKEGKLLEGIANHYSKLAAAVKNIRAEVGNDVPALATGHLFVTGAESRPDDGVRPIYVGTLGQVPSSVFLEDFDYVALGHIHRPQLVRGKTLIRYSGSPIPMSFGETNDPKSVCIVEFSNPHNPQVTLERIPIFQSIESIDGPWSVIEEKIKKLSGLEKSVWLEIIYSGEDLMPDLLEKVEALIHGTQIEVLKVKNLRSSANKRLSFLDNESLDELSEIEIFERCMSSNNIKETEKIELRQCYSEILQSLQNRESNLLPEYSL